MLRLLVFVPFIASAVLSNYVEPVYEHHVRGAPSSQWAVPNPSKRDIRFEGGGAGSVELDAMKINSGGLNGVVGGRGVGGGEGFAYFQIPPPHLMRAIPLSDGEVAYVDDPRPRELRIQGGGAGSVELDPMSINAGGLNGIIGGRGVGGGEGFGYFQTPGVYGMRAVAPGAQTVKAIGIPHYANEEVPSPFAKMIAVPQYSNDEQPSRIVKAIGIPHYANEEEPSPFAKMIAVPQYSNGEQPSRIVRTNAVPQYPTSAHLVRAIAIPQYTNAEQPLPIVRAYAIPQYSNGEQSAQVVRAYSLPQYSNDDQSPQLRELRIQGGGAGTVELDPMSINSGGLKGVIGGRGVGGGEGFGYFQTPEAYVPADENESTKLRELRLQGGGAGSVELDPMKVNAGGLVGVIGGRGVGGGEGFGYFQTPNARKVKIEGEGAGTFHVDPITMKFAHGLGQATMDGPISVEGSGALIFDEKSDNEKKEG